MNKNEAEAKIEKLYRVLHLVDIREEQVQAQKKC